MKHNLTTMKTMLVGMTTVWCSYSFAQQHPNVLWYDKPAQYWEEALPLGNGRIGAMVYGNPSNEEIQLNEETISAGSPYKNYNPDAKKDLPAIRNLIFEGKYPEAQAMAETHILSKNGFGMPYQTAGSLHINFPGHERFTDFRRELDVDKAVATTTYTVAGVQYKREIFTSFTDQLVIVRLTASQPGKLTFSTHMTCPQEVENKTVGKNMIEGVTKGDKNIPAALRFRTEMKLTLQGGKATANNDTLLSVQNATTATFYITMATNFVNYKDISGDPVARNKAYLKNAGKNYAKALQTHIHAYEKYYKMVYGMESLLLGTLSGR